jgi:hypothetical protein
MLVDSWRELSDTVAERAVALGVAPDGRSTTVGAGSGVAAVARGGLDTTARWPNSCPGSRTLPRACADGWSAWASSTWSRRTC